MPSISFKCNIFCYFLTYPIGIWSLKQMASEFFKNSKQNPIKINLNLSAQMKSNLFFFQTMTLLMAVFLVLITLALINPTKILMDNLTKLAPPFIIYGVISLTFIGVRFYFWCVVHQVKSTIENPLINISINN